MTVESQTNKSGPYNGNGAATVFAYEFRILDAAQVRVVKTDASAVETDLTLTTDYTVSGVGDPAGGNVTLLAAPVTGEKITLVRNVPFTQGTDFENQGAFFADTHEDAFDKSMMAVQQVQEEVSRSIKVAVSDETDPNALIESLRTSEANAATSANEAGVAKVGAETAQTAAEAAQAAAEQTAANIGVTLFVADAPPVSPETGMAWFDTRSLQMFIWYEDGDSSQWIEQPCSIMVPQQAGAASGLYSGTDPIISTVAGGDFLSFLDVGDGSNPKRVTKTNLLKEIQAAVTALNGGGVATISVTSQAAYDLLAPPDANTLYLITS